jgi:hypothetical protein
VVEAGSSSAPSTPKSKASKNGSKPPMTDSLSQFCNLTGTSSNISNIKTTSSSSTSTNTSSRSNKRVTASSKSNKTSTYIERWGADAEVVKGGTVAILCDEEEEKEGFFLCDVQSRRVNDMLVHWRKKFNPLKEEYQLEVGSRNRKPLTARQPLDSVICGVILQDNVLLEADKKIILQKRAKYLT